MPISENTLTDLARAQARLLNAVADGRISLERLEWFSTVGAHRGFENVLFDSLARLGLVFPTWKTVKMGNLDGAVKATSCLKEAGFELDGLAQSCVRQIKFAKTESDVELVCVSPRDLGLPQDSRMEFSLSEICLRARTYYLEPCPAEAVVQMALQHPGDLQAYVHSALFAMEPIPVPDGRLSILFPTKVIDDKMQLTALSAGAKETWPNHKHWVFVRKKPPGEFE